MHTEPVSTYRGFVIWSMVSSVGLALKRLKSRFHLLSKRLPRQAAACVFRPVNVVSSHTNGSPPHHHLMGCHHTADLGAETLFLIARIFLEIEWMLVMPTSWTCLSLVQTLFWGCAALRKPARYTLSTLYTVFPAFYLQSLWLYMVTFSKVQMVSWLQLPLLFISSAAFIFLMVSFITLIFSAFTCHLACFCRGKKPFMLC